MNRKTRRGSASRLRAASAALTASSALALTGLVAAPAAHASTLAEDQGIEVAYVDPGGHLVLAQGQRQFGGPDTLVIDTFQAVAPGTHPAITGIVAQTTGKFEAAFNEAGTGHLWTVGTKGVPQDTGLPIAPQTSPAIADLRDGTTELAWVGGNGHLMRMDSAGVIDTGAVVVPNTSPTMTSNDGGFWAIGFQSIDARGIERLSWIDRFDPLRTTGNFAQPGTSPAIIGPTGSAWYSSDVTHRLFNQSGTAAGTDEGVTLDPASSPAQAGAAAVNSADHRLTMRIGTRTTTTNLAMDPGASPATVLSQSIQRTVIVEGTTHKLYTYFGDGSRGAADYVASTLDALPGSTPAVAEIFVGTGQTPPPPSPEQVALTLQRQQVGTGPGEGAFIPYTGTFTTVPANNPNPWKLNSITVPQVGVRDTLVSFVKAGHGTQECGDPNAVVTVPEGGTIDAATISTILNTTNLVFSTSRPVTFVACFGQPLNQPIANSIFLSASVTHQ